MTIDIVGQGGLNFPLVADLKVGPDEGMLQRWITAINDAAVTFEETGTTFRHSSADPQAWYGGAAESLRARAIEMGLASDGVGEILTFLGELLAGYLTAAQAWDTDYAAAKVLDQAGVANDSVVATAYAKAWSTYTGTLTSPRYVIPADIWPMMDPALVGSAPPPDDIIQFNSPQKLQAVADTATALNKLSAAGGFIAQGIAGLLQSLGSSGSLGGLIGLGATSGGRAPSTGAGVRPDPAADDSGEQLRELNDYLTSGHDVESGTRHALSLLLGNPAEGASAFAKASGLTFGYLGAVADLLTLHDNPDSGIHGDVTAGAAGVNLAATALGTADAVGIISLEAVPVVDVGVTVIVIGTGLYSLGNTILNLGNVTQSELP